MMLASNTQPATTVQICWVPYTTIILRCSAGRRCLYPLPSFGILYKPPALVGYTGLSKPPSKPKIRNKHKANKFPENNLSLRPIYHPLNRASPAGRLIVAKLSTENGHSVYPPGGLWLFPNRTRANLPQTRPGYFVDCPGRATVCISMHSSWLCTRNQTHRRVFRGTNTSWKFYCYCHPVNVKIAN